MRRIDRSTDIGSAIQSARREATTAFGDGTLYVERAVDRARHVEVQIVADAQGALVHLFERECSTQRRHQKIIEESPSPGLTPQLRARMTAAAVAAARAAAYRNAGTIEFLLADDTFYFLEMNTRLQVEHPVTEQVAGVDLVHAQIAVASGEPLPWTQSSLTQRGHAIEARIYAEDPRRDFVPQAGRLLLYREPRSPGIRIDSGVVEGCEVSIHYDPLLAKVIATGEHRRAALARLVAALRDFPILGIQTNIPFLLSVLQSPRFESAAVDTGYVDAELDSLIPAGDADVPAVVAAAVAAHDSSPPPDDTSSETTRGRRFDPWNARGSWGR
jgi:acetyl/propionyl-CoA carboxylase alpha subunit